MTQPLSIGAFCTYREQQMRILFQDGQKLALTQRYEKHEKRTIVYAEPAEIKPIV